MATFKELADGLSAILKEHPELADREVYVASECGFWNTGFESPITIAVPVFTPDFQDSKPYIQIVSDDDGYRIDEVIANWEFIPSEKEN